MSTKTKTIKDKKDKKDKMDNNNLQNQNNKPKKKIGFYWVYIILIAFFIGSIVFGSTGSTKTTTMTELSKMLRDQDIEKIELVNGKTAEIYLNEQGIRKYFPNERPQSFGKSPDYILQVSEDRLYAKVDEAQQGLANPIEVIPVERHNWGAEVISWVLPLVLIIGFWVLIMRRMGGGDFADILRRPGAAVDFERRFEAAPAELLHLVQSVPDELPVLKLDEGLDVQHSGRVVGVVLERLFPVFLRSDPRVDQKFFPQHIAVVVDQRAVHVEYMQFYHRNTTKCVKKIPRLPSAPRSP